MQPLSVVQRNKIRQMFFARVDDSIRRNKIIELAASIADEPGDDDFYRAIYHYSLRENWDDLENDHAKLVPVNGWQVRETEENDDE